MGKLAPWEEESLVSFQLQSLCACLFAYRFYFYFFHLKVLVDFKLFLLNV